MRLATRSFRPPLVLFALGLCLCATGCLGESGASVPIVGGELPSSLDPAGGWIGTFEGPGEGVLAGMHINADTARLEIRIDPDSVRTPQCPRCLTLTMDTLFVMSNVPPTPGVSLTALYLRGPTVRSLRLDRFSGGGGTDNVLLVRLQIDPVHDTVQGSDMGYLLERR